MSLFGLLGDIDDDPFMGGHVRRMNSLMHNLFRDPFADVFGGGSSRVGMIGPLGGELMPFSGRGMQSPIGAMMLGGGFPTIMDQIGSAGNSSHMSSMSTVMTMTHGPDGRPQVYQASQSVRQGPGGIRETKKTVADSRTGLKKMSIGRHVYDRGHVIEREQNIYSGDREENEEFINLDEDEAEDFNKEWETRARQMMPGRNAQSAIGYGNPSGSHRRRHGHGGGHQQLALPSSTSNMPQPPQRIEEVESDSEDRPRKKMKSEHYNNDEINKSIIISEEDDEEEVVAYEGEVEEVEDSDDSGDEPEEVEYYDEDDDDEVEEVIDSDSERVVLNDKQFHKQK